MKLPPLKDVCDIMFAFSIAFFTISTVVIMDIYNGTYNVY